MDEVWFDYDSGWESELDDQLDEFYEHESSQDRADWTNTLKNNLTLIVCSIASAIYFICLILVLFWCNGVIRFIYATRALILMLTSLTQIAFNRILTESVNLYHNGDRPTDMGSPIGNIICSIIIGSLFYTEEILPLFFLHELCMCTSKMELREQQILRLFI